MAGAHPGLSVGDAALGPLVEVGSVKLLGLSSLMRDTYPQGPGDHVLPALSTGLACGRCVAASSGSLGCSFIPLHDLWMSVWAPGGFICPWACRLTLAGYAAQMALPLAVGSSFMLAAVSFQWDWDSHLFEYVLVS